MQFLVPVIGIRAFVRPLEMIGSGKVGECLGDEELEFAEVVIGGAGIVEGSVI